jgi:DNA-binding NarL/FixJ family response regulator
MAAISDSRVCRVFLVEDSPFIVRRMTDLLSELNGVYFLGNAESIPSALQILSENKPDVMILDIHLGKSYEMNGIELLNQVRQKYPQVKVIMLTNVTDSHYRKLCMDGGADYFFDKSNDFEKIPETLSLILQTKT